MADGGRAVAAAATVGLTVSALGSGVGTPRVGSGVGCTVGSGVGCTVGGALWWGPGGRNVGLSTTLSAWPDHKGHTHVYNTRCYSVVHKRLRFVFNLLIQ